MAKNRKLATSVAQASDVPATPNADIAGKPRRARLKHPKDWGRPHPDHGPVRSLPRLPDGSIAPYYYMSLEDIARFELPRPSQGPNRPEPLPAAVAEARRTGLYDLHGRELPPTHPDHGPMRDIPRQEDGSIARFYYNSKDDLELFDIKDAPPRRARRDGWTPDRMAEFVRVLRATASVSDAANAVGMHRSSAYKLYAEPDARAFREAWDEALRGAVGVLAATAFDRAVNGVEEVVYHKGQRVGVKWRYDNRLLMSLLRVRDPFNYAPVDELEGWRRNRALEGARSIEPAIDRLAHAEAEWGRRLPHENAPAAHALAGPGPSGPAALPDARDPSPAPTAASVSTLSTSAREEPDAAVPVPAPASVSTLSTSAPHPEGGA